jgi:hypothetical protein
MRLALLAATILLAGCGTFSGITFENRVACTVAKDKAYVVSEYGGWVGISSKLADQDREYVCK